MTSKFVVYVPNSNVANLDRGLSRLVWGWEESVLNRGGYRAVAASIRPGDRLILATGGGDPRGLTDEQFSGRGMGRVHVTRVSRSLFSSTTPVWDDAAKTFPNRVAFEVLSEGQGWGTAELGQAALTALKLSANNRGAPVHVGASLLPFEQALLELVDRDDSLGHDGEYDGYAMTVFRREQRKLRSKKLAGAVIAHCDLCGRLLPAELLRAAHIKRRADCTIEERDALANVLLACTLGCDELFERGYIGLRDDLTVLAKPGLTGDAATFVAPLRNRAASHLGADVLEYVQAHRSRHGL